MAWCRCSTSMTCRSFVLVRNLLSCSNVWMIAASCEGSCPPTLFYTTQKNGERQSKTIHKPKLVREGYGAMPGAVLGPRPGPGSAFPHDFLLLRFFHASFLCFWTSVGWDIVKNIKGMFTIPVNLHQRCWYSDSPFASLEGLLLFYSAGSRNGYLDGC